MMDLLEGPSHKLQASDRKLRLFAVACCRRIWHLLGDTRSRWAVEVADRFAEGNASYEELAEADRAANAARSAARAAARKQGTPEAETAAHAAWCAEAVAHGSIADAASAARAAGGPGEPAAQSRLLHCVFGPTPFQPLPAADDAWLVWNDNFVGKLAADLYEQQRFADLPLLADALEDAGCTDTSFLGHLRSVGPHVRGCWVLDCVLGKQ